MRIVAKFTTNELVLYREPKNTGRVKLNAVYKYQQGTSGNACKENHIFGTATPSGDISMSIQNPTAFEWFKSMWQDNKDVYVIFAEELPDELRAALGLPPAEDADKIGG